MTIDETTIRKLTEKAETASRAAYAPHSDYRVGAALLTASGSIYTGCNVENAAYSLALCAERNAVTTAISEGATQFQAIAIATKDGGTPCGACRQVLAEFCGSDFSVILFNSSVGSVTQFTLGELLPHAFRLRSG